MDSADGLEHGLETGTLSRGQLIKPGGGAGPGTDKIASAARFLASDAASYITGTTLTVDGGRLAH